MADLATFSLADVVRCSSELRVSSAGATSMEEAAVRVAGRLYDTLVDGATGERAVALIRLFKTHPYGALEPEQRAFADRLLGDHQPEPAMPGAQRPLAHASDGQLQDRDASWRGPPIAP